MASVWAVMVALGLLGTPEDWRTLEASSSLAVLDRWVVTLPDLPLAQDFPFGGEVWPGKVTSFVIDGSSPDGVSLEIQGLAPALQALRAVSLSTGKTLSVGQDGRFWGIDASEGPIAIGVTTLGSEPAHVSFSRP